jgi:hypothetical protein
MAAPSYTALSESPELIRKRALLYSVRIRYCPETQPIREAAIDRIVQQLLLAGDNESGLTSAQLHEQDGRLLPIANFRISLPDIRSSLDRLSFSDRVSIVAMIHPRSYRLSEPAKAELAQVQADAEQRLDRIIKNLFKSGVGGWRQYEMPFLRCLSTIFANLTAKYVGSLTGEVAKSDLFQQLSFDSAIREARAAYPETDESSLRAGMIAFFMEDSPDYSALKWNTAQNYYVAKALGLDPSGALLSREVFAGAELYLDTNVLISALEPVEAHHRTFKALGNACKNLGVNLAVTQISLDELRNVVEFHKETLRRIGQEVPEALRSRIGNIFYELYLQSAEPRDLDSLFHNFSHPLPALQDAYGIELIDSAWFVTATFADGTRTVVEKIQSARKFRKKTERAALHDALLVRWVEIERSKSQSKVWIITRDRTLPNVRSKDDEPLAISLDALLQWIAPISSEAYSDSDFLEMFSESIRLQLLPPENFLDLKDFCLLADVGVSCKDLPVEDVEACIVDLKVALPAIDPTQPGDREKISHQISKFFADPGRRYKANIRQLEIVATAEKTELLEQLREKDRLLVEKDQQLNNARVDQGKLEKTREDLESKDALLAVRNEEVANLRLLHLRSSANRRLCTLFLVYIIVQVGILIEACLFGGANWLIKASTALPILGGITYLGRFLGRALIGGDRVRVLGHRWKTLLGVPPERDRLA